MTLVMLVGMFALAIVLLGGWSQHRRRQLVGWDRELEEAFGSRDRGDLSMRRVL